MLFVLETEKIEFNRICVGDTLVIAGEWHLVTFASVLVLVTECLMTGATFDWLLSAPVPVFDRVLFPGASL